MRLANKAIKEKFRIKTKQPSLSIKWKLFMYLAGFCAFILILLWVSQIVFLDDFYYMITVNRLRNTAEELATVETADIQEKAEDAAIENEVNVLIYLTSGKRIATVDFMYSGILHKLDAASLNRFYNSALEEGGESVTRFRLDFLRRIEPEPNPDNSQDATEDRSSRDMPDDGSIKDKPFNVTDEIVDRLIFTKVTTNPDGQSIIIMLDCAISPVSAITNTLVFQLGVISCILVLAAILLALIISRRVSKPIININKSAKLLAKGNYETGFSGRGYKEIAELSDTLNYAANELSKVDSLRRELIANVSHDLRTPLTMITGYSEVMRDIPGENTPENIQVIIDEAKRLSSLVNDLLEISKYQSGGNSINRERFSLSGLLRDTVLRYRKMTDSEGYKITFECAEELDVYADKAKILQVVYNLINNAINYTGEDKQVVVRLERFANTARVEVADTGEGISPEQIPYIWDRYYKVDKVHRRASVGTGLGLSIVKGILQLHGADYGVISNVSSGSIFWFELECAALESAANDTQNV